MIKTFNLKESSLTNLRPVEECGEWGLEAALPKKTLPGWRGWRPLVRLDDEGSEVWLFAKGTSLAGGADSEATTPLPFEVSTPGAVTGAVATSGSTALVVCRRGCVEVEVAEGVWTAREVTYDGYPAVSFRATTAAAKSVTVGDRALSVEFQGLTTLGATARRAVCGDLADAYAGACASAAAEGLFAAPVLLWCRYLDSRNRTLLTTPPVALRASADFNPWVETTVQDLKTVKGYTLSVPCFGVEAEFEAAASPAVAAVEIYGTPCLHPYREGRTGSVAVTRDTGLRISLPGFGHDVTSSGSASAANMRRITGNALSMGRLLARVERPFTGTTHAAAVCNVSTATPATDGVAVDGALARGVSTPDLGRVLTSAPHTFGAEVMCADAGAVVFGGLRSVRSRGWQPLYFASATAAAAGAGARALVTVTFAGAGRPGVTCRHDFADKVPTALGPVLSYPSPDAATMRVTVYDGSKTRSKVFALTPDASGARSVYIEPGLKSIVLPEVAAALVTDVSEPTDAFERTVAVSSTGHPLDIKLTSTLQAPLRQIAALRGADTAWEFGRSRFVGAGAAGLTTLAVGSGLGSLSAKRIDGREPAALCEGAGCVYAALDGEVVSVGATSRKAVRVLEGGYTSLSWDGAHRELLAFSPFTCRAVNVDSGIEYQRPEYAGGEGVCASGVHFTVKNGLSYSHIEDASTTSAVGVDAVLSSGSRDMAVRRLCVHLSGSLTDGSISLSSGGAPMATLSLSGEVRRPVVMPVLYRKVWQLRLKIEGDSDGLRITSAKVRS